jgi:hypothetical protein
MKILHTLAVLLLCASTGLAGDPQKVSLPLEVKNELRVSVPPEIEGKVWNRWTTKNFVVCSLDDTQAQYLHQRLELVKGWVFSRWGLYDVDFSSECKIICVSDPELFEKMFRIKSTKVEVRRDADGKIKETVIFMLLNDNPSRTVPSPLTEVCLAEFSQKYDANFGWWAYRGMSLMNGSIDQIRATLNSTASIVKANDPLYFSKGLLDMKKSDYMRLTDQQKHLYDQSAMTFCLLVRKEFGQDKFHHFLKAYAAGGGETAIREQLKFNDYDHFDRTFKRYLIDLTNDLAAGKTPDHYLQITGKK